MHVFMPASDMKGEAMLEDHAMLPAITYRAAIAPDTTTCQVELGKGGDKLEGELSLLPVLVNDWGNLCLLWSDRGLFRGSRNRQQQQKVAHGDMGIWPCGACNSAWG